MQGYGQFVMFVTLADGLTKVHTVTGVFVAATQDALVNVSQNCVNSAGQKLRLFHLLRIENNSVLARALQNGNLSP